MAKGLGFAVVNNRHGLWTRNTPWLRVQGCAMARFTLLLLWGP